MSAPDVSLERLFFLLEVAADELRLLQGTDGRLFALPMDEARVSGLKDDPDLAERVDAFVARFGRLQDTLGDKLLPELLRQLAEPVGPMLDNLDRAERFGWLGSADEWLALRKLRNRMIHEYVRNPAELAQALLAAHGGVAMLAAVMADIGFDGAALDALVKGAGDALLGASGAYSGGEPSGDAPTYKGDPDGREYDEGVEGEVASLTCPHCGKLVPRGG